MQAVAMNKAPDAFRTISEVAEDLDIPQHVLRFWETRFTSIRPLKRGGGRRYYRPDDVELLRGIRHLLYGQGYTIKGVQRILKEEGLRVVQDIGRGGSLRSERPQTDAFAPEEDQAPTPLFWSATAEADPRPTRHAPQSAVPEPHVALAGNDLDRLRGALTELLECQRMLDALRRR